MRAFGEGADYYLQVKALYLRDLVGGEFSGPLLDYGCGIGLLSRQLERHLPAARLEGFDPSPESVARVTSRGRFTSNPESLGRAYPLIVVSNVMHHVPQGQRQELVAGAASRLSPGGQLVIFEHNPLHPLTRWVVSQCPFDEDAVLLWPGETRGYLRRVGLDLRQDYILFFPKMLAALRPLERWLGWLPLGAQYAVVGRRVS